MVLGPTRSSRKENDRWFSISVSSLWKNFAVINVKNWSPYREVEVVGAQVRGPRAAAPDTAWPVRAASGRSEDVGSVTAPL